MDEFDANAKPVFAPYARTFDSLRVFARELFLGSLLYTFYFWRIFWICFYVNTHVCCTRRRNTECLYEKLKIQFGTVSTFFRKASQGVYTSQQRGNAPWFCVFFLRTTACLYPFSRSRFSSTIRRTTSANDTSSFLARAFSHLNWPSLNQIPLCLAMLAPVFGKRTSTYQGGVVN